LAIKSKFSGAARSSAVAVLRLSVLQRHIRKGGRMN
jgi:hypothetical protein